MSKKTAVKKPRKQKQEEPKSEQFEEPQEPQSETLPPPEPETTPAITLESLQQEIETIKLTIIQLQETLARKRKPPASNGKVQILDKQTNTLYPSKNNAYQTLLKSGELQTLVDKGIFGDIPRRTPSAGMSWQGNGRKGLRKSHKKNKAKGYKCIKERCKCN